MYREHMEGGVNLTVYRLSEMPIYGVRCECVTIYTRTTIYSERGQILSLRRCDDTDKDTKRDHLRCRHPDGLDQPFLSDSN